MQGRESESGGTRRAGWRRTGGDDEVPIDFHGGGAIQQLDAADDAVRGILAHQDAFHSGQGAVRYAHAFAGAQEGPRRDRQAGTDQSLHGVEFGFAHGGGLSAKAHDADDAGSGQHFEALFKTETAEDVAREQRELDGLSAIGPAPASAVQGQVMFERLGLELFGYSFFVLGFDDESEPIHWIPGKLPLPRVPSRFSHLRKLEPEG